MKCEVQQLLEDLYVQKQKVLEMKRHHTDLVITVALALEQEAEGHLQDASGESADHLEAIDVLKLEKQDVGPASL